MPGYSCVTLLARRTLFESVGQFHATLQHGVDLEWFLRAAEHGAVMEVLPDVLVFRRLHQTNRSRHLAANSQDTFLQILKHSLDRRRQQHEGTTPTYQFPASKPSKRTDAD